MNLDLKVPWNSEEEKTKRTVGREFYAVQDQWGKHNSGMAPWMNLFVSGTARLAGLSTGIVTKAAAYTLTITDQVVLVDSTAAIRTMTLPTAVGFTGIRYTIKDWKGQSATNNITIATTSSQTIDGVTTKVLNQNYVSYTVVSDGANWAII